MVGACLQAARDAHALAGEVAATLPTPELVSPLAALQETLDAFEVGLAVDAAELRARLTEALRHLLPLCALMQPPSEVPAAPTPEVPLAPVPQGLPPTPPASPAAAPPTRGLKLTIEPRGKSAVLLGISAA